MPVCARIRDTTRAEGKACSSAVTGCEPVTHYVLRGPRFARKGGTAEGMQLRHFVHDVKDGLAAHRGTVRITMLFGHRW